METATTGEGSGGTTSDPGSSSGGSSGGTSQGNPSTGGTSQGGTNDETAGPDTEGGSADCSYDGDTPWVFLDELDMPRQRGVGSEDNTCNPVTTDTTALEVRLDVPANVELGPTASVRVLLFEYDPDVADAPADCVGGTCSPVEGDELAWTFDVPNDLPELGYYVSVDLDDGNGCILNEVDFVEFSPAQGTLTVPMTNSNCI
jgi:hypothetical protein